MPPIGAEVEISMMGRFAVRIDGRAVTPDAWPGRRSAELFQLLALSDRRRLLRDQVLESLFPHLDPAAAAANLRKAAHQVRVATGLSDSVVLRGGSVSLFPDHRVVTDVEVYEAAAASALASGEARAIARAADRWGGELLPDSLYEEWSHGPRLRLRKRQVELLRAIRRWVDVVSLEPTDEAAYQELMREAAAAGSRAGAIRWYDELRTVLRRELGVEPSDESVRLHRESMAGLVPERPALHGRTAEMAVLGTVMRPPRSGARPVFTVGGPAGIGKSAVCRAVGDMARTAGWWTVEVPAAAHDEPYAPVVRLVEELLTQCADHLDRLAPHARAVLSELTPMAPRAGDLVSPLSRHQVLGALRQLMALLDHPGAVVVLDDAHRADAATLDLLAHLGSSPGGPTVVFSHRGPPDVLGPVVARLRRGGQVCTVDLDALDPDSARALVDEVAGPDLSGADRDRVVAMSGGNPFALTELARSPLPAATGRVAPTVAASIAARLVDVDEPTLAALRRAAAASVHLDAGILTALAGPAEPDALEIVDTALAAGVLVVDDSRFRFRHDLVRQALIEELPPHRQAEVNRDVAARLETTTAGSVAIAAHWRAGGHPERAVPHLLDAAREAMRLGAFADARTHVAGVLSQDPRHPGALRIEAEALDVMGDTRALAAYDAAVAVAPPDEVGDLLAMRALAQIKQGDPAGAVAAVADARPTTVLGRLSEALTHAGAAALGATDPTLGTAKAAECRRLALESGDTGAIVIASWAQAAAAHARGELHESVLADLRDTSALPHLAMRVFDGQLCITQRFLYGARPYADVVAFASGLADEGARLGAARGHAFGVTLRGEAELLSGDLDAAARDLADGAHLHRQIGGATGEAHALQRLAEVAIRHGDRDRAHNLLSEALDLARVTDIGFHLLDRIYGTLIELAASPEDAVAAVDEAEEAVRGPLETCPGCRITFAVPAAIALARAGKIDRALEWEHSCEFLAHVVMRLPAWDAAYEEVRGHIARAEGDDETACRQFDLAARGFARAGQPWDRDRCTLLAAAPA